MEDTPAAPSPSTSSSSASVSSSPGYCRRSNGDQHEVYRSPTAIRTNSLLWGSITDGIYGVLVRAPRFSPFAQSSKQNKKYKTQAQRDQYAAASLLHASMRPPNSIFSPDFELRKDSVKTEPYQLPVIALMAGRKNGLNKRQDDGEGEDVVNCTGFYPVDSASGKRKHIREGTSCYRGYINNPKQNPICLPSDDEDDDDEHAPHSPPGRCLSTILKHCECNFTAVPGSQYAAHLLAHQEYSNTEKEKGNKPQWYKIHHDACWARATPHGLSNMIDAQNSLYLNRDTGIFPVTRLMRKGKVVPWARTHDNDYWGWNECTATSNIHHAEMIDAIVIKLPPRDDVDVSLCSLNDDGIEFLRASLEELYWSYGYASSLPVLIMRETKGMSDQKECEEMWGGVQCDEGYRKEFVSQTWEFDDGSCLSRRPASWIGGREEEEVYFYAANATNNPCHRGDLLGLGEGSLLLHLPSLHASVGAFLANTCSSLEISNLLPVQSHCSDAVNVIGAVALVSIVVAFVFVRCRLRVHAHVQRTLAKGDKQA